MNKNNANPASILEIQETIQKLTENGFGDLVECLIDNESVAYTKKGRLNKSATCRAMGWKSKQLEDALEKMKELLSSDFNVD